MDSAGSVAGFRGWAQGRAGVPSWVCRWAELSLERSLLAVAHSNGVAVETGRGAGLDRALGLSSAVSGSVALAGVEGFVP